LDRSLAWSNLCDACAALDSIKVPYWLTDGTLLGFIRNGDFIAHDNDIDLGVHIKNYSPDIIKAFKKIGFKMKHQYGCNERGGKEYTFKRDGIKVDIFFFYDEENTTWHGAWLYESGFLHSRWFRKSGLSKPSLIRYGYKNFALSTMEIRGKTFSIPENPIHYLEQKYGKDWSTPVKDWNWATSPKNIL